MLMEGYFVDSNGVKYYPRPSFHIGYILESAIEIDPGTIYGGTWELYGIGRTTVCVDSSQSEFNSIGKTGGEKEHTLLLEEIPPHTHQIWVDKETSGKSFGLSQDLMYWNKGDNNWANEQFNIYPYHQQTKSHNNMPPYITVYRYVRIA